MPERFANWHREPEEGSWNDHIHSVELENPSKPTPNQWTLTITAEAEVVKGNQPDEEDES